MYMRTILVIIGLILVALMVRYSIKMDKAVFEDYNAQDVAKVVCNEGFCS